LAFIAGTFGWFGEGNVLEEMATSKEIDHTDTGGLLGGLLFQVSEGLICSIKHRLSRKSIKKYVFESLIILFYIS
jgi:hypothetical protein